MTLAIAPQDTPRSFGFPIATAVILVFVALVYWQVQQASFVWDDKLLIHDNAWLSVGDGWRSVVFHGLADWRYFRPLGLALFVAEIRLFGIVAGPMHLLSLGLHLIDTALVGALAWRLCPAQVPVANAKRLACAAMLIYGLHPALVEPIAWISCQCDPLVTVFMLLGLLANLNLQRTWVRAALVTACFFLAAGVKEAAVAFPVLLVLLDWLQSGDSSAAAGVRDRFRELMNRQRFVYLGVFAAGIVYLVLRHWARASAGAPYESDGLSPWERFQAVSFTYMTYWKMIVLPFVGLSPAHIIPNARFAAGNLDSIATDIAAVVVGLAGLLLAWRRKTIGALITGAGATLFPVLHVIPISFEDSLYHERYALPAIAWVCVLLPRIFASVSLPANYRQIALKGSIAVAACWLALATLTVRTTVPLWFNELRMWQWALKTNPDSIYLMSFVLNAEMDERNLAGADEMARILMPKAKSCAICMMHITNLALDEGDPKRAAEALKYADAAMGSSTPTRNLVMSYVIMNGRLQELEHNEPEAESAFRDAISIDPMHAGSYMPLAFSLAAQGKADEARKVFDKGISLSAPDEVESDRRQFAAALATGAGLQSRH